MHARQDPPLGSPAGRRRKARCAAERAPSRDPGSTTVDDIATHELVTVGPDQDAVQVVLLHELTRFVHVLVVEGDRLVGIISEADLRSDEAPLA